MRWVGQLIETIAGCWQLLRLLILSRFRLKGRYWVWRNETAFGTGKPTQRSETIKAALDYGRWMARIRKLGRPRY
ncbi:MAG: hypothetical protein COB69_04615 [Phycisphaera sp.]|nr:MAG: hypothetical protein COB69_04615 [Phycisphaera sp.]